MTYEIEFEDHGQDLLYLTVHEETGEIVKAGPFHHHLYADGTHFVYVDELTVDRIVRFHRIDDLERSFIWPMSKLSLNGNVLAQAQYEGSFPCLH